MSLLHVLIFKRTINLFTIDTADKSIYLENFLSFSQVLELRRQIEKQSTDLGATHRSLSDLRAKNAELEERLIQVNKEMHQSQEIAKSLECELNENVAQKGDQEERIATLEKRYH